MKKIKRFYEQETRGLSWIKREKEAIGLQVLIQLYPSNSRFNNHIHILNMQGFNFL
jgi:hypothetical protein